MAHSRRSLIAEIVSQQFPGTVQVWGTLEPNGIRRAILEVGCPDGVGANRFAGIILSRGEVEQVRAALWNVNANG